ncbi:hypothetical protein IQ254_05200 [Nodosilinea sp. LEGE 07088]|uniref:hypothetical protein n=1 Tax=Nodosilinea sp. LEGE 07088 TaxID=2777968 RepID=UPI0018819D32|nr:hypothetical protein [Nodosilinea sp. LEGE 07088]MBE9136602.1 hypothetical protein [Nodosilinea sp. LEGE 07088]
MKTSRIMEVASETGLKNRAAEIPRVYSIAKAEAFLNINPKLSDHHALATAFSDKAALRAAAQSLT